MSSEVSAASLSESADHVDTTPIPTPTPRSIEPQEVDKRRSAVWNEYLIIEAKDTKDGKKRAQCIHCKSASFIADSHYGTSNMRKHLDKCKSYQESTEIEGKTQIFNQKNYRELVAKAIIKHGYSFSWVEHDGNREIHAYLNNQVRSICRNTAKSDCLKLHGTLKSQLKKTLRSVPGRICLTSDMWTSCQTDEYLCLTAHYVDANWMLTSKVLNFSHIESPHTGKAMYAAVLSLLQSWGIQDKIFSITLDNASSNDKMQDYLKSTLNGQGFLLYRGSFFHVRCAAHVLNLIVNDGLNLIKPSLVKIRESVKYVKWSESRKISFKNCVSIAMISETKGLWLDVPTRWNSTYVMLDRALLYRDAFKQLAVIDSSYKNLPGHDEWEMMEKIRDDFTKFIFWRHFLQKLCLNCHDIGNQRVVIVHILAPFAEITELFSGSEYPTANLYFENVWNIGMILQSLIETEKDGLREMAINMKIKFDKYWVNSDEDDYTMLFAFAVVLDPRCKLQVVTYCYQKLFRDESKVRRKVSDLKYKLEMLMREYAPVPRISSSETSSTSSTSSRGNTSASTVKRKYDFLADFDTEDTTSFTKSMLDVYLDDLRADRKEKLNILSWWKVNESRYGELSHLARDILSVPLTTVASESTFSIGGRILNKWRSSYLPENVEALITTRSWLYGYESNDEDDFLGTMVDWSTAKSPRGD